MNLLPGSFKSKVARRIFFLFVACALLPTTILAILSFVAVTDALEEQTQRRLQQEAKSAGMQVLARLEALTTELQHHAALISRRCGLDTQDITPTSSSFSETEILSLTPRATRDEDPVVRGAFQRLIQGEPALIVKPGVAQPILAVPLECEGQVAGLLGTAAPDALWLLLRQENLPAATRVEVLAADGSRLFASTAGGFELHESESFASRWSVFLMSKFGAPAWTIELREHKDVTLAPLRTFRRIVPLALGSALLVVVLLSSLQIRRSLYPLEKVREATARVAEGDYRVQLDIMSEDEFGELAHSFNSMSSRIDEQFRTLSAASEIDRQILSSIDRKRIVSRVLARIPELFQSDFIVMTVMNRESATSAEQFVCALGEKPGPSIPVHIRESESELIAVAATKTLSLEVSRLPEHLHVLRDMNLNKAVMRTLIVQNRIAATIALGYSDERAVSRAVSGLGHVAQQLAVALSNANLIEENESLTSETVQAFARAIDAKSSWTAGHSERVTALTLRLARRLGLPDDELTTLYRGGMLHDIGKIGVPLSVLDKPGRLDEQELKLMQAHTTIGAKILAPLSAYKKELPIVLHHHERFDGRGYPMGLAGNEIPLHARILAVADVFDALTSDRPYRAAWSEERALDLVRSETGKQFDPDIAPVFMDLMQARTRSESSLHLETLGVVK